MVNTNIQGVVPIQGGVGLRYRPYTGYVPGEFKSIENLMIRDGILTCRPALSAVGINNPPATDNEMDGGGINSNLFPYIISKDNDNIVIAGGDNHKLVSPGVSSPMTDLWSPDDLPLTGLDSNRIKGYFTYNSTYYWITEAVNSSDDSITMSLYYSTTGIASIFADLSTVALYNTYNPGNSNFIDFMVFKDRLFILHGHRLFYSSPTDVTDFSSPSGGFIDIPDVIFKCMTGIGDYVYIGHSNGIHLLSFSSDPGEDGSLRPIYNTDTAMSIAAYEGRVYVFTNQGLGVVEDQHVNIILTKEEAGFQTVPFTIKPTPLGIYIIHFPTFNSASDYFFYQPNENFLTKFSFKDNIDEVARIHSVVNYSYAGGITYTVLLLKTNGESFTSKARVYTYQTYDKTHKGVDRLAKGSGLDTYGNYVIDQGLEINSYVPDGNEYFIKKFRSLLLMGELPKEAFQVELASDDNAYGQALSLSNTEATSDSRPPFPIRLPIMKRARALSLKFGFDQSSEILTTDITDANEDYRFSVADMRVFWNYTQRGPTTKTPDASALS